MIWFLGLGIIVAIDTPVFFLAYHYNDELVLKMSNRVYWMALGTWNVCYGLFFETSQFLKVYYPIFGLVCIWFGTILLIRDYVKKVKESK